MVFSVQFDGEKPDKITRGACVRNDHKVIFENPLNLRHYHPDQSVIAKSAHCTQVPQRDRLRHE